MGRYAISGFALLTTALAPAIALPPVTGRDVPELAWATALMRDYMEDNSLRGGLLAIMKDGCIVYQRGFGYHDEASSVTMPENALVRIASCSKPFTAAAVKKLINEGHFSLDDFAFDLGQTGGGLLAFEPFPELGDTRLRDVTVGHLLEHRGGWDRDIAGDLTYRECDVSSDMGVPKPPGRLNTLRWILGKPLQFDPGSAEQYSNIGSLALGLIVEQVSGLDLRTYLVRNILTPGMWVPGTELLRGRTFEDDQAFREAWYDSSIVLPCVFESRCFPVCIWPVPRAYGSFDVEARIGQGGIVLNPATMLAFLDRYRVQVFSAGIGDPLNGERFNGQHNGGQPGVNCRGWQRTDGVCAFVWFNRQAVEVFDDTASFADEFAGLLNPLLDEQTSWPTECVDGFWAEAVATPVSEWGSFDRPFSELQVTFAALQDGSRLKLKPGGYEWTGIVSTRLEIRAPLGTATIGQ